MADEILARTATILAANAKDLATARSRDLSSAMLDRLTLNPTRVEAMAQGIREVAALPDPGRRNHPRLDPAERPPHFQSARPDRRRRHHLRIAPERDERRRRPLHQDRQRHHPARRLGVDPFEPRDRRGPRAGGAKAGLPNDSVLLIPSTDREAVRMMAEMDQYIDLIVPRGGKALIETVVRAARMPVIKHYDGICIIYVDKDADLAMATDIVVNAKTQRPASATRSRPCSCIARWRRSF